MADSDLGIIRWKPFLYRFFDYLGKLNTITFTCPFCGGHNCKKIDSIEPYNFWSGHFCCTDCGCKLDSDGYEICYFSSCFSISDSIHREPIQLSLF